MKKGEQKRRKKIDLSEEGKERIKVILSNSTLDRISKLALILKTSTPYQI